MLTQGSCCSNDECCNNNGRVAAASLQDFVNFHGMLCRPSTARHCVNEFRGGTVLFMPNDYGTVSPTTTNLESRIRSYDCSLSLTTSSYYALVLVTFTGLMTCLGLTKFLVGREKRETIASSNRRVTAESNPDLVIQPGVFDYIAKAQGLSSATTNFFVKRRFEYNFGGLLSVMMIHLGHELKESSDVVSSGDSQTHLVEVYRIQPTILRFVYRPILSAMGWVVRSLGLLKQQKHKHS